MFALDTNTIVHFFKGKGRIAERLLAISPSEVAVPAVVLFELEVGTGGLAQPGKRRSQFEAFLSAVLVLPFDEVAAKRAAEVACNLRRTGFPIGPLDTLIAGTALANNATLVTHNVKEFRRVRGLSIVDWY